ncbi:glycine receptor subunit alpha-4-like [Tubulanus polymorphus]|uniref:glycine receptor subunit alpha-4-like n=1 Tax=Tubulanus polymorphus TaxID=672921 RepID=UPI003DA36690
MASMIGMLEQRGYDKYVYPSQGTNNVTIVHTGIYINSISSINELAMEMDLDIFLRHRWHDPRLKGLADHEIEAHSLLRERLWQPDLFFLNSKNAYFHDVTKINRAVSIFPDGKVRSSIRVTVKLHCPMFLRDFPMDEQTCPLTMESYSMPANKLQYKWHAKTVEIRKMQLPRFNLYHPPTPHTCSKSYRTGNFSCLQMDISLNRQLGYYLIQVYVPSFLVVTVSWVSFWLSPEATPARTSVGVVTVLTVTTQNANIGSSIPKVSYVKAIDIWYSTCLFFVFAALLEFAMANTVWRKELQQLRRQERLLTMQKQQQENNRDNDGANIDFNKFVPLPYRVQADTEQAIDKKKKLVTARKIDIGSRIVFPVCFLIFNLVYWPYYLRPEHFHEPDTNLEL